MLVWFDRKGFKKVSEGGTSEELSEVVSFSLVPESTAACWQDE